MYTIRNSFHGTEARTRGGRLSERQEKRLKRSLCPSAVQGCTCSGTIGERGPQECEIDYAADGRVIVSDKAPMLTIDD